MRRLRTRLLIMMMLSPLFLLAGVVLSQSRAGVVGQEVAIPQHLQHGDEFNLSVRELIAHGLKLFTANWTIQEGGGRPLTKISY